MVAPNGARRTKEEHPAVPVTIPEIVKAAKECYVAGADGIHTHVRNQEQKHTLDVGLYRELIAELKREIPEMTVQISSESLGSYSPQQQQTLVQSMMPQSVSIALLEIISGGNLQKIGNFFHWADENCIAVQHILYSVHEVELFFKLITQGMFYSKCPQILFVLGRHTKGQEQNNAILDSFISILKKQERPVDWALCAFGVEETQHLVEAHRRGGKIRVGFENSIWNADGSIAKNNAERVTEIRKAIAIATPAD